MLHSSTDYGCDYCRIILWVMFSEILRLPIPVFQKGNVDGIKKLSFAHIPNVYGSILDTAE